MRRRYPSMSSLVAFEAVARHRSFLGASKELALSQSTVSYRIKNLEETIGVQLFLRLTRRVKLTAAGEEFLVYANSALREVANGIDSLLGKKRLTVTLSTYLAARWLSSRLNDWNSIPGSILVELNHDFSRVNAESDINIVWTKDTRQQESCSVLFQTNMTPYCTPEIAASLTDPSDIFSYPLLAAEPEMDPWPEWFASAGVSPTHNSKIVIMPDSNVRIGAATDGLGIVLGNHLIEAEISEGKLVRPFEIDVVGPGFHIEKHTSAPPVAEDFVAWLKSQV